MPFRSSFPPKWSSSYDFDFFRSSCIITTFMDIPYWSFPIAQRERFVSFVAFADDWHDSLMSLGGYNLSFSTF